MIDRRTFLKYLLSAAGIAALPVEWAKAGIADQYESIINFFEGLPEHYFTHLSSTERARILNLIVYTLRQHNAQKRWAPYSDTIDESFQETLRSIRSRQVVESPCRVYLGDTHGHSKHSDGLRSANKYYKYAKMMGLDFAFLTDHAEILSPAEWALNQRAADKYNAPGRFVTLQAYEYTNSIDGNYDIYMLTDPSSEIDFDLLYAWYNFFLWLPREFTNENVVENPALLFEKLKRAKHEGFFADVIAVPHHCSWLLGPTNWKYFDPELIPFAEGYSKHGNSLFPSWFEDFFDKVTYYQEGTSVLEALNSGKQVGINAATDTHGGLPGSINHEFTHAPGFCYSGGLTGVLINEDKSFDRRSMWQAMKQRHVFGTRVYGLQMSFRVDESEMGSEIYPGADISFYIEVYSPENEELLGINPMIAYIEIIKNGSIIFKQWDLKNRYHVVIDNWKDPFFDDRIDNTYFLRVVGYTGDLAWSSPIFIKGSGN
jgi:hypothetical protein